ncbi:MAG: peptidase [Bacillota bacterium]
MNDREHAIKALTMLIRANEKKAGQHRELAPWFKGLNHDLMKAVENLKRGA